MFPSLKFRSNLLDNPIARREAVTLARGRSKWFWRFAYGFTALLLIAPLIYDATPHAYKSLNDIVGILLVVNVVITPLVVLRTIATASDIVMRERNGHTWDLLRLTGISAWRVVLGKWLGVMRHMLHDFAWVFVLRAGTFFWGLFLISFNEMPYLARGSVHLADADINALGFLLAIGLTVAVLGLELLFSAAIGVMSALFPWSQRAGVWVGIGVRVGVAAAFGFGLLWVTGVIRPYPDHVNYPKPMDTFIALTALSLSDTGAFAGATALATGDDWTSISGEVYREMALLASLISAVLYSGLTLLTLRVAKSVAYRVGIDEANDDVAAVKAKRKPPTAQPSLNEATT